ncbi:HlyD family secretion protein [Caulobacter sp. KR2-114]|uniref:HlyD family secretion protein n=1 Tax=Caulobacter sp. KR2-114 TaxID=3400912 RepID=UPI003BFD059C
MKRLRILVPVALVLAVLGLLAWKALAPRATDADVLSGYLEGEALYLASPSPGAVTSLGVVRGQRVAAGAPLFSVDARSQEAQHAAAQAELAQARRQGEAADAGVAEAAARLTSAKAQAANAERDAARFTTLQRSGTGAVSTQEADRARTAAADAAAQANGALAALKTAQAQAEAARAGAERARAQVADTEARLAQFSARAPAAGRIEETFFQAGEWAGANQPIVSLIPDGKVKLKFYVPERDLALYRLGRTIRFTCDGCRAARQAVIAYVSPRPEYTPPVIYSRKSRDRMVFLIEARPTDAADLSPGQPADVEPLKAGT